MCVSLSSCSSLLTARLGILLHHHVLVLPIALFLQFLIFSIFIQLSSMLVLWILAVFSKITVLSTVVPLNSNLAVSLNMTNFATFMVHYILNIWGFFSIASTTHLNFLCYRILPWHSQSSSWESAMFFASASKLSGFSLASKNDLSFS